ncbi:putative baseplate assembly protein [Methanosarcina sp. WWM596]|uniref:putative baseplate assembly protein n=1 Tax=Methanosarcina sp. WWM596 TaxID=1434103 RepID=UPI0006159D86|nr:putative baseplate assembly protein [Methanosarcina sp. WWM596]AKB18671.1 hypothetical protein MSWHS_1808 [Methanosarcina sp. WWM596]
MPKIDSRNFQKLLEEKRSIAPLYTPEWDAADDMDTGVALLKIFTHMQEEIISRLNRVPEKNFAAFLEMIGLKLMPAQPAKVPVTFYLPENLSGGVFVPAGTMVAADETERHKVLNFETTNGIFATSAAIEEIYGVDPDDDSVYRYTDNFFMKKEFSIFETERTRTEELSLDSTSSNLKNKQDHILYLGHKELFNLKNPAIIELHFEFETGSVEFLKNFIWEYWGENDELKIIDDSKITPDPNKNNLKLQIDTPIKEKEINGIKTRWIRCRANKVIKNSALPVIKNIQIKVGLADGQTIKPDIGYFDQVPLEINKSGKFYIFGQQPCLLNTFYIANREAFSKRNAVITITFIRNVGEVPIPDKGDRTLPWEYWNGKVWCALSLDDNKLNNFVLNDPDHSGSIKFKCPADIEEIEVNGVENYWIRVRLVDGNYGKYDPVKIGQGDDAHWEVQPNFKAPIVNEIKIQYYIENKIFLQRCLSCNNLECHDFTQESEDGTGLKLFTPLPEKYPTLYIGFKDSFKKGNIGIFFSLKDMDYPLESRPKIKWTYWSKAPNLIANITSTTEITLASTAGISIGTVLLFEEIVGSRTITGTAIVDSLESNGTITLKEKLNYDYTRNALVFKRTNLEVTDNTHYLTTTGTLEFIGPPDQSKTHKFGIESYWLMGELIKPGRMPLIKGIYPNTVWAEQVETIKDEILGSGDGEKNKSYNFFRVPVISPEIWVRHENTVSKGEEDSPSSEDINEIKDDTGKTIEMWVRWKVVDDFVDSGSRSRHCTIDNAMGILQFGDGKHGMIPPIGQDNIKATYKTGGGVLGNVAENEIKTLMSSIAGIDHITNHEPAEGGSDTELLSEIFERGPHLIKHRDRAVTKEDFERLAKAASSYIARTKCLVINNKLTVIVIPKGEEDKPQPSRGLLEIVRKSLLERSLNMILEESLVVTGPTYGEIKVKVDVIPESIDQAIPLEKTILNLLKEYLHPLTGGNDESGWEFGRGVHISEIYAMLEGIKGVDHVENLTLNNSCEDISIDKFKIVCSGEHEITMRLGS